jgi:hypothetical protein
MVQRITVQTPSSTTPVKGEKKHINRGTWSPIEPRVYVLAGPEPAIVLENAIPIMGETKQKRGKKEEIVCLRRRAWDINKWIHFSAE